MPTEVAIIPAKHDFNSQDFEELKRAILPNKNLVPDGRFTPINYFSLMKNIAQGLNYDVVIARRLEDKVDQTIYNICVAAYDLRHTYKRDTVIVITYNEYVERTKLEMFEKTEKDKQKIDMRRDKFERRKKYIDLLFDDEGPVNGIILTKATDESFLMNIIRDIMGDRSVYLNGKFRINDQRGFLVYPPDHTVAGVRPGKE